MTYAPEKPWEWDKKWADSLVEKVREILNRHALEMLSVAVQDASREEDTKQATDFVVITDRGPVAVRVRRPGCSWRDWTIRAERRSGVETELAKIRAGFARWYLYAWCRSDGAVGDYVIIDLDKVRSCGILDLFDGETQTGDGGETRFISVPVRSLRSCECLLVDECRLVPKAVKPPPPKPKDMQGFLFPPGAYGGD